MKSFLAPLLALALLGGPAQGEESDFVRDNVVHLVRSTPIAAVVAIDGHEAFREIRDDQGRVGYITFKVRARVLEPIKGSLPPYIEFFVTQEQPSRPPDKGNYLVTLERTEDGRLVFADDSAWWVGFTPELAAAARAAALPATPASEETSPHADAIQLVMQQRAAEIRRLEQGTDGWMDSRERSWRAKRTFEPGVVDTTHEFIVTYAIDGGIVGTWHVDTRTRRIRGDDEPLDVECEPGSEPCH